METRLLKLFLTVARHGTLAAASREIHLSPSALSHGLKELESGLGTRLFDRISGRLVLNQAGEQFLAQIQRPLAQLERAAREIKSLHQWGSSRVRIAAPSEICLHLFPAAVQELSRAFPSVQVLISSAEPGQLFDLLESHQVEMAVTLLPEQAPGLALQPLFQDELLFAFASEHRWSTTRSLGSEDIQQERLLTAPRGSATGEMVRRLFARLGFDPRLWMEIASEGLIAQLVKRNLGVGLLAPWVLADDLDSGQVKLRPVGARSLRRDWIVAHRASGRLTWAEEEFVRICRQQISNLRLNRNDLPATARISSASEDSHSRTATAAPLPLLNPPLQRDVPPH